MEPQGINKATKSNLVLPISDSMSASMHQRHDEGADQGSIPGNSKKFSVEIFKW